MATADRPATEPRTPTGRAYLAELNGEKEPPEEWRDARGYLPKASRRAWEHDRDMILAIEAAARDEGRQEAVQLMRDHLNDAGDPRNHQPELCHQGMRDTLDRVAGLNASEPPPTVFDEPDDLRWGTFVGATSESGQQEQSDD